MGYQSLGAPLPTHVISDNKTFKINTDFRRVLTTFEVLKNDIFSEIDKINIICSLFIRNKIKLFFLQPSARTKFCNDLFEQFVVLNKQTKNDVRALDFLQDSKYIFAAFWQAYNINLFSDNLHWWEFYFLLNGLPADTRMAQIIDIRTRPLPKPTKYNAEERKRLIRLKHDFRVQLSPSEQEEQIQRGLAELAHAMEAMSNRK